MVPIEDTLQSLDAIVGAAPSRFGAILIDPPWRFQNRTGKVAPEHRRLARYETMAVDELARLPVGALAQAKSHIYLWCPNALLAEGLQLLKAWGFTYKTNLVWYKVPCLSGLHPHPLGLEWAQTGYKGARHGCSRPRRSPIPAFATRVSSDFSPMMRPAPPTWRKPAGETALPARTAARRESRSTLKTALASCAAASAARTPG